MKEFVAVVGATGAVGRKMLEELELIESLKLPVRVFASERSAGSKLNYKKCVLEVEEFQGKKLKNAFVLMSAGGDFSKLNSPGLVENGCIIIDNSSAWRMDSEVPLVVPEVNPDAIGSNPTIIANPNCSTIQMVVTLKPLLERYGLNAVHVATYQSVSGAGQKGIEDLARQLSDENAEAQCLPRKIAHDVIPAIDRLQEDGHCFEEIKMVKETRKILGLPALKVTATTVRVPTVYGHGEAITVELASTASNLDEVKALFEDFPGMNLVRESSYESLPTPRSIGNSRKVHVARLRFPVDSTESNLVQYWNVANNLNKGAATNAVQILIMLLGK